MVGQGEVGFGLGAVGLVVACAGGVRAASDLEGQSSDGVQGGDGAEVGVVKAEPVATLGAMGRDRFQGLGMGRLRAGAGAWHAAILLSWSPPTVTTQLELAKFATLEKKGVQPQAVGRAEAGATA